jgi:hypothetical protein
VRRAAAGPPDSEHNQGGHRDEKSDEKEYPEHVRTATAVP